MPPLSCLDEFERFEADDGYTRESPFKAKRHGTEGHVFGADAYQKSADLFLADTLYHANNLITSTICKDRLIYKSVLFLH